jgi:hypothetical protein
VQPRGLSRAVASDRRGFLLLFFFLICKLQWKQDTIRICTLYSVRSMRTNNIADAITPDVGHPESERLPRPESSSPEELAGRHPRRLRGLGAWHDAATLVDNECY